MAKADGNFATGKLALEMWTSFEARLPEMVFEHPLEGKGDKFIACFDPSQVVGGFHVIACKEQFFRDLVESCVAKAIGVGGYQRKGTPGELQIFTSPYKCRDPRGTTNGESAKLKVFCSAKLDDALDRVVATNKQAKKMKIDGPTGIGKPPYVSRSC